MHLLAFPTAKAPRPRADAPATRRIGFHALATSVFALLLWLLAIPCAQAQESL